jgi:hypothetical protein
MDFVCLIQNICPSLFISQTLKKMAFFSIYVIGFNNPVCVLGLLAPDTLVRVIFSVVYEVSLLL